MAGTLRRTIQIFKLNVARAPRIRTCKMSSNAWIIDRAYVNGEWIEADSRETFEVYNPSTGHVLGRAVNVGSAETHRAIQHAHQAFNTWKKTTAKERSTILRRWHDLIVKNAEELAKLITLEMGKPIAESRGEIAYGAGFVEWYAEEGRRLYGETIPSPQPSKRIITVKQPIGVVGMVTPWNFPHAMITRKASAALCVGCSVVLKPAEDTPFSALALAKLADEAGIPPGVFNVLPCDRTNAPSVGETLCKDPLVTAFSFTGSTAVGKLLLEQCASTVKKVSLELGGNAPFIVFDSADVKTAAQAVVTSRFRCSGQTCVCSNRVLVQEGIHAEFVAALSQAVNKLRTGDGLDPDTTQGPLINQRALSKVDSMVADARSKGAQILTGGVSKSGLFYEPTVIDNASTEMQCVQEESFGPLLPIVKFRTEEEAVLIANGTESGLAGYFFSGDVAQCWRVAEALEYGMVGINEGIVSAVEAPFGGVKQSGLGREGARQGLDEFTQIKYMCFGNISKL